MGRRREAIALVEGALRLARVHGYADTEGRALNGLAYVLEADDLERALAFYREGLELQRRLGRRSRVGVITANLAGALVDFAADWDEPLRMVGELLPVETGARDRFDLEDTAIFVDAARGELEEERFAAHRALVESLADSQRSASFELTRSSVAWCRGDFEAVVGAGLTVAEFSGKSIIGLSRARWGALWLRDAMAIPAILERLEANPDRSRFAKAARYSARAALAGLEGRTAEAVEAYQRALRLLHECGFEFLAAETALDFLWAVGPDVPEARAAAEEARAVFERVRARVYLDRLDSVMGRSAQTPSPHPNVRTAQ